MKRIFLDSDIILDALLKRPQFEIAAKNILLNQRRDGLYTSSSAFINVHYFLNKFDRVNKNRLLSVLRSAISIINVDEKIIDQALESNFADFEDAVQYFAAIAARIDFIITRNTKDYKQATIPVLTPEQFLKTL